MQGYFANFVKTGNPNGDRLPKWTAANAGGPMERMRIDVESRAEAETRTARYQALDKVYGK